jgi:hypothetical protein
VGPLEKTSLFQILALKRYVFKKLEQWTMCKILTYVIAAHDRQNLLDAFRISVFENSSQTSQTI